MPVLLFPEGTSTDGSAVLRFHSALFQPAIDSGAPVTPASITYLPQGETSEREVCWFADEAFLSHLWRTLGAPAFSAEITFGPPASFRDRRTAALVTHELVAGMRAAKVGTPDSAIYCK